MRDFSDDLAALAKRLAEAERYLDLAGRRKRLAELEEDASRAGLWDDPDRARAHPIHNPFAKINQFWFDSGWRQLAALGLLGGGGQPRRDRPAKGWRHLRNHLDLPGYFELPLDGGRRSHRHHEQPRRIEPRIGSAGFGSQARVQSNLSRASAAAIP